MTEPDPTDPVIGGGAAMLDSIEGFIMGFADLSMDVKRSLNTKIARSRSQSPSSLFRKSDDSSRAGSPRVANSDKIINDRDPTETATETSSLSTKVSTSTPLPSDIDNALVSAANELADGSSQTDTRSIKSQPVAETQTKKQTRTINDIRDLDLDGVISAGKSAAKLVNLGLRAPASFTMAVSKGFHNTPLLYGDETVREQTKVTGFKSGLMAAGKVCTVLLFATIRVY